MSWAGAETWRRRAAEAFNHRTAEVVKHTRTERNYHTCYLDFLPCLPSQHRNFDGQSIMHGKNRENWDQEVRRIDGCVSVSVFIFNFFFFLKTAISNERFVFVYSKLILLKLPGCRLFCPQQSSKHIKVPPSSPELTTWWLFVQNYKQHPLLGVFYLCGFFLQIKFFSAAFWRLQFSQCVAHTDVVPVLLGQAFPRWQGAWKSGSYHSCVFVMKSEFLSANVYA